MTTTSTPELGLATVVFNEDLDLFSIQLASMEHYLASDGFGEFMIIDNSPPGAQLLRGKLAAMVRDRLGVQWRRRVRIVRCPSTIPYSGGYRRQQVLKLWAGTTTTAEAIVILDAKNSFVGECSADDIVSGGRARIALFDDGSTWLAGLNAANSWWGLPDYRQGDLYAGPYTPFVLVKDEVAALVRRMAEQLAGPGAPAEIAWEGFCFDPRLQPTTEFLLYSQYLTAKYGSLEGIYRPRIPMSATLFGHWPDDAAAVDALRAAGPSGIRIIGLHRRRLSTLSPAVLAQLERLWSPFGIDPCQALGLNSRWRQSALREACRGIRTLFW